MSTLVDRAVEALRALPPSSQDEMARLILALAEKSTNPLPPDVAEAIAEAEAEIAAGARVPDNTMRAFWASHEL